MDSSGIRPTSPFALPSTKGVEKAAAVDSVSAAGSGKEDNKDQLNFSPGSLRGILDKLDLFGAEPRADGSINIEDIRANYAQRFEDFAGKLSALLKKTGIDRGCASILRSDGQGKIRVANNHPQRENIEALFENNPELANEFRGLSGTASFLRAADEHSKFAAAYAKDPEAAVRMFSHLFDETGTRDYAMRITSDDIMGFFE
ncbi:MAG: hypothetical protein JXM70_24980 [Pirellulales bacterium]|nr:hypothetical protein [Pirellulales bacterium]